MPFDEAFLEMTIKTWQPLSKQPLTMADAQEIAESMIGFFAALARCAKEQRSTAIQKEDGRLSLRSVDVQTQQRCNRNGTPRRRPRN